MNNDRWIEALMAPLLLGLLLSSQDVCASSAERWHVITIDGTTVGSMHETEERGAAGWVSTESSLIALNRMGSRVEIRTFQESVESDSGRLKAVRQEMKTSDQTLVSRGRLEEDEWVMQAGEAGSAPERRYPIEGELLGPRGIRAVLSELGSPGDVVEYRPFLAHLGRPGSVRAQLLGFEQLGDRRLRVVREVMDGMPAPMTRLLDSGGYSVVMRMPGPFGLTETMLADQTAARLAEAGGELGEEVFRATLVETGVRLPDPRSIDYLEIELRHRNPSLGWPDFESTHQTVLEKTPQRLVLAVERRHPRQSVPLDYLLSETGASNLTANALLKVEQPELVGLAHEIVGDESDTWQAALKLERWVAENMAFDMGVVLAPSDEVLENRRGTCTEYAILLTALARAAGIPARYVGGYVYVHGIFGGHAWTEVLIGEQWVALDAAIPTKGPADAARIAFQWTGLDDGLGELNSGAAVQVYGQIDGRILAWQTADGEERRFPDGAPAPGLVEGRFVDDIQGIEWSVPAAWRIVDYGDTWPSNRIAAAQNDEGDRVDLRWVVANPWQSAGEEGASSIRRQTDAWTGESIEVGGRRAWSVERDGRPALAIAGRDGFWVLDGRTRDQVERLASQLSLPSP